MKKQSAVINSGWFRYDASTTMTMRTQEKRGSINTHQKELSLYAWHWCKWNSELLTYETTMTLGRWQTHKGWRKQNNSGQSTKGQIQYTNQNMRTRYAKQNRGSKYESVQNKKYRNVHTPSTTSQSSKLRIKQANKNSSITRNQSRENLHWTSRHIFCRKKIQVYK